MAAPFGFGGDQDSSFRFQRRERGGGLGALCSQPANARVGFACGRKTLRGGSSSGLLQLLIAPQGGNAHELLLDRVLLRLQLPKRLRSRPDRVFRREEIPGRPVQPRQRLLRRRQRFRRARLLRFSRRK